MLITNSVSIADRREVDHDRRSGPDRRVRRAGGLIGLDHEIIEFRAGWGIGNALFIATSLAVIIASASGGFAGAIVLYETALGLGIAVGPLVGGTLGAVSWRGPFSACRC